jgi:hypothetical protein
MKVALALLLLVMTACSTSPTAPTPPSVRHTLLAADLSPTQPDYYAFFTATTTGPHTLTVTTDLAVLVEVGPFSASAVGFLGAPIVSQSGRAPLVASWTGTAGAVYVFHVRLPQGTAHISIDLQAP